MSIITIMSIGVIALDIAIVCSVVVMLLPRTRMRTLEVLQRNALPAILALSALSIIGTLYMEYAQLLAPCYFCWWQRIFMYPIGLISLTAFVKGKRANDIADYVLVLAIPGFAVALYQHLLQVLPQGALIPCDATNDCAIRSVFEFGFVTIPWMSLSVFAMLIFLSLVARLARAN